MVLFSILILIPYSTVYLATISIFEIIVIFQLQLQNFPQTIISIFRLLPLYILTNHTILFCRTYYLTIYLVRYSWQI